MASNKVVELAQYEIDMLSEIKDPVERARIQAKRLALRQDKSDKKAERWAEFKNKVNTLDPQVMLTGCLLVQTGTRSAVFTPEMARSVFGKNLKEIQALVATLPETADFSKIPKKAKKK